MQHGQRIILLALLGAVAGLDPARAGAGAPAGGQPSAAAAVPVGAADELRERRERSREHVTSRAAEGPVFPTLHGEVLVELRSDIGLDSTTRDHTLTVEPAVSIGLSESFSIEAGFVLEPVSDPGPGGSRRFDDEGLFVETFLLRWARGRYSLHAGKFNPAFGFAWDLAPGIYGVDFAEDYEISERIGFGGTIDIGNAAVGRHRLGADAFSVDTSPLSRSLFYDRGRTRRSDGGPGNTASPQSFAITLRGGEIPKLPRLTYNLGFAHQQRADVGGRSERDAVAGLGYGFSPFEDLEFELLSEYAYLDGAGGESERRHYFTQSAAAYWRGWNAALSYTGRWIRGRDGSSRGFLFQASAGYAWEIGAGSRFGVVGTDVGWRRARDEGAASDGFGVLVSYSLAF